MRNGNDDIPGHSHLHIIPCRAKSYSQASVIGVIVYRGWRSAGAARRKGVGISGAENICTFTWNYCKGVKRNKMECFSFDYGVAGVCRAVMTVWGVIAGNGLHA